MSNTADVRSFRHGTKPVLGLIGGIGAGKSTVSRCLQERGGTVIDADVIGHSALEQGEIIAKIVARWGDRLRKTDGSLDRRVLAAIVFANPAERNALESLVFPYIGERCREEMARAEAGTDCRFIVLDAAVMLEAGWKDIADRIVYVDAPREVRLARVASRNGWNEAELLAREQSQWPAEVKKSYADAVILNDGDGDKLQREVDHLLTRWGFLGDPVKQGVGAP